MNKKRIFLFRALTVFVLLLIAATMMVIGRGHTVYFDNKALEYNGKTYETPYKVEISVKGEEVAKLREDERGMVPHVGQNFKMSLEVTQEKGGKSVVQEISLKLPYSMDGVILNIPALLEGLPEEAYLTQFIPAAPEEDETEDEVSTDEFGEGLGDI